MAEGPREPSYESKKGIAADRGLDAGVESGLPTSTINTEIRAPSNASAEPGGRREPGDAPTHKQDKRAITSPNIETPRQ